MKGNGKQFKYKDWEIQWAEFCSVKAQNGRSIGGQRSMDYCGFRYCTINNVNKRLDQLGLKGKAHNIVLLDLVLLDVSREATMKRLWRKLGILYKSLLNKLFLQKNLYNLGLKDPKLQRKWSYLMMLLLQKKKKNLFRWRMGYVHGFFTYT